MGLKVILAFLLVLAVSLRSATAGCSGEIYLNCTGACAAQNCTGGQVCLLDNCNGCNARCVDEPMVHITTTHEEDNPTAAIGDTPTSSAPATNVSGSTPTQSSTGPTQKKGWDVLSRAVRLFNISSTTECTNPGLPLSCGTRKKFAILDPCKMVACAADRVCEQEDFCGGCRAVCKKVEDDSYIGVCPKGMQQQQCPDSICADTHCPEGTSCEINYCGECSASCKPTISMTEAPAGQPSDLSNISVCAQGVPQVQCKVDPCATMICSKGEVCQANYCGQCTATCVPPTSMVDVAAQKQERSPRRPTPNSAEGPMCPKGTPVVQCFADPCLNFKCGDNETCESNYCGDCNAVCKPNAQLKPAPPQLAGKSNPASTAGSIDCPADKPLARCLVDPCRIHSCGTNETCHSDYCGGCNAYCAPTIEVAPPIMPPSAVPAKCPVGVKEAHCLVNPCAFTTCPANSTCEVNYCGGCNAVCKPIAVTKCSTSPCSTMRCATAASGTVECVDDLATCTGKCVVTPFAQCNANKNQAWNETANACMECSPGSIAKLNRCTPCPVNTYYSSAKGKGSQCVKCPVGKSTKGKQGAVRCG